MRLYSDPNLWALLCKRTELKAKPKPNRRKKLPLLAQLAAHPKPSVHVCPGSNKCNFLTCPKYQPSSPSPLRILPASFSPIKYRSKAAAQRRSGPGFSNSAATASTSSSTATTSSSSSSIQTPASSSSSLLVRTSDPRLRKPARPFQPGVCPSASPPSPGSAIFQQESDSSDSDCWISPTRNAVDKSPAIPAKGECIIVFDFVMTDCLNTFDQLPLALGKEKERLTWIRSRRVGRQALNVSLRTI